MIPDLDRLAELAHTAHASADQYCAATDRLRQAMGMSSDELAVMRDRIRALTEPSVPEQCATEGHAQFDASTLIAAHSTCRCGAVQHHPEDRS